MHPHPLHSPGHAVRSLGTGILRLLYPALCAGCGAVLPVDVPDPLCLGCMAALPRAGLPEVAAELHHLPGAAGLRLAFALWEFRQGGPLQRAHHLLKYGNRPLYGVRLGHHLGVELMDALPPPRPDLILPVPLHRTRLYERGYNQSAMLARGIAEVTGIPVREDLLLRSRSTRTQTRLARVARWQNVHGAFTVCRPEALRRRHILLVDDILTTGATLLAAAAALSAAGAASLITATLGYAKS